MDKKEQFRTQQEITKMQDLKCTKKKKKRRSIYEKNIVNDQQ